MVGGAGVAGVVRQSYSIVEEELTSFFNANGRNPSMEILDNIYVRFENNRVMMGPLKPTQFLKVKERVRRRIEMIGKLWQAMEVAGENKVEKALNIIIKQASNEEEHG